MTIPPTASQIILISSDTNNFTLPQPKHSGVMKTQTQQRIRVNSILYSLPSTSTNNNDSKTTYRLVNIDFINIHLWIPFNIELPAYYPHIHTYPTTSNHHILLSIKPTNLPTYHLHLHLPSIFPILSHFPFPILPVTQTPAIPSIPPISNSSIINTTHLHYRSYIYIPYNQSNETY